MNEHGPASGDPRLGALREKLLPISPEELPLPPGTGEGVHAAVSLVLRSSPGLDLLLIRRAESATDPWSGHMALPGGRRESGDPHLLATALRETREETGVGLRRQGMPLGRLEPVAPSTRRLPRISIFPFVFGVGQDTEARVASREVEEVLWAPLPVLRNPGSHGTVTISLGDTSRDFPCFRYEGRVIWGLTYRILTRFMELLPGSTEAATGPGSPPTRQ